MKSKIELFGTSFTLHSDEHDAHIQSLVSYIRDCSNMINRDIKVDDALKHAILTLLLITHELQDLKETSDFNSAFSVDSLEKIVGLLEEKEKV